MDRYRGNIEDFLQNVGRYEDYLREDPGENVNEWVKNYQKEPLSTQYWTDRQLIEGRCTPQGTFRFAARANSDLGIPQRNFRKPVLPSNPQKPEMQDKFFHLSTVGLGTYLGLPDDETDFEVYNAAKLLVQSGGLNVIDTAINYRCQKSERAIGAALNTLLTSEDATVKRDELFICSKNGYIPDDSDLGKSASMLTQELIEEGLITREDVAAEIHCMHPRFLEHQLEASKRNLGLQTIDLMYLHNAYESQANFLGDDQVFMDKLARAFEFYEGKRDSGDIQYYGMATWLCFRAKEEEEKIYLNLQKVVELAEKIGGSKNMHGLRFI
mmetsp:Transcript_16556/g.28162  ORF Transcript_16556/g.28162 Transcript_16556/m.28162 type:complete len:326 (+) Transcript_16556:177-1154(+)